MKGKRYWLVLVALGLLFAADVLISANRKSVDLWLAANVIIGADGRIASLEWHEDREAGKAIAKMLEPEIRGWEFEPGTLKGAPTETRTRLTLRVALDEGDDGAMAVRIRTARTGAYADTMSPPRYPPDGYRNGVHASVVTVVDVATDGTATIVEMIYSGSRKHHAAREAFLDATRAAVATWHFIPERVGGHSVATRMRIPVAFCLDSAQWCKQQRGAEEMREDAGPPDTPVALESAVRLLTPLNGGKI